MESALVRKDAVMLHDPMRTHKRATVIGVLIGVVILIGFLVVGIFKPAASLPADSTSIVIAQPSGQVYVLDQNPRQLIPVFNLTSARLLMLAMTSSSNGSASAPNPTVVSDTELAGVPMGRLTGIPDGPQALPNPSTASTTWSVCDAIPTDTSQPDQGINNTPVSTAMVGQSSIGNDLPDGQALLARSTDGNEYLIYHKTTDVNQVNNSAVVAQVDTTDPAVTSALLNGQSLGAATTPRKISAALLNAIPKVGAIQDPFQAKGISTGSHSSGAGDFTVGETFESQNQDNSISNYAVLPDGVQQVSQTVAQILAAKYDRTNIAPVPAATLSTFNVIKTDELGVADYPGTLTKVIAANVDPVVCLGWTADYSQEQPAIDTRVTVATQPQLPTDSNNAQVTPLKLGQVGPNGIKVDQFVMDPKSLSLGVAVRSVTNPQEFNTGPITLLTPRGVAYSIDSVTTAQGLGVANSTQSAAGPFGLFPAPASILGLLPVGAETLNTTNVQRTFDSVQVPQTEGQYTAVTTTTGGA
jgi:type VII secretion protein EccB